MKSILVFFLCVSSNALGQLYSSYSTEGVMRATGGPVRSKIELVLRKDSLFTVIQKTYGHQENSKNLVLLDSAVSGGTWSLQEQTLLLDFNPDNVLANKKFDTYRIRKKGLTRTTLKEIGITTKYKASGQLLGLCKTVDQRVTINKTFFTQATRPISK
jgi:hypothetical protein